MEGRTGFSGARWGLARVCACAQEAVGGREVHRGPVCHRSLIQPCPLKATLLITAAHGTAGRCGTGRLQQTWAVGSHSVTLHVRGACLKGHFQPPLPLRSPFSEWKLQHGN